MKLEKNIQFRNNLHKTIEMQALENANKLHTVLTIIVGSQLIGSSSNFNDLDASALISLRVAHIYLRMVLIIIC